MVGTAENPFCKCGEVENVDHYLLHCQEYEDQREKMNQGLFLRYGIKYLSVEQFLEEKEEEEETKYTQKDILTILDNYIDSTKRFQIKNKIKQTFELHKCVKQCIGEFIILDDATEDKKLPRATPVECLRTKPNQNETVIKKFATRSLLRPCSKDEKYIGLQFFFSKKKDSLSWF